ncbi:MAG: glucan 1,4-alpha-glucosidase, partial [Moraxellaceae bacterium]
PNTQVYFARGADLVEGRQEPRAAPLIEPHYLRASKNSAENGLTGEYFRGKNLAGIPVLTRVDTQVAFRWDRNSPTDDLRARGEINAEASLDKDNFSVRWSGQIIPPISGEYEISLSANDGARLTLNKKLLINAWQPTDRLLSHSAKIMLEAGKAVDIQLDYFEDTRDAEIRLAWRLPGAKSPLDEALELAAKAETIVFVGGLTSEVEGEEMKVNYPGFNGGDRTDLHLPKPQQQLLEALHRLNKPIVLVLTGGGALAVDWAQHNIPAILMAWYPGEAGGTALADILFGDVSPAGRLPITVYSGATQLPDFQDYSMQVDKTRLSTKKSVRLSLNIKNTGTVAATEIVQLYIRPLKPTVNDAIKQLRAFNTIQLQPGEEKTLHFNLNGLNDFAYYDEKQRALAIKPGDYEIQIGASSTDIRLRKTIRVRK